MMRWIRLLFGVLIGAQALVVKDGWMGLLSVFFLFQAFSNTGCCGTTSCAPSYKNNTKKQTTDEIIYEEIK
jgi:hypothetical protein